MSEDKIVVVLVEPHAPLSDEVRAEMAALAEMPDESIDTSDIPPLDETFWKNAVRNPFYRPPADALTVELDPDVLAWLRSRGGRRLAGLNTLLRREMARDPDLARPKKTSRRSAG